MNVVEAYIKFNKKLVIFISGLHPGSGKTKISKNIKRDFKINYINQKDYSKKNYKKKVKLPNGKEVINWDSDESIDWDKFNNDIKKYKKKGVIVNGISFNNEKVKIKPDFHIHLSISKKNNLIKRKELIEKDKKYSSLDFEEIKLIMNQLTYPYYLETLNKSNINKFINTNKFNSEQVYDQVFDSLMEFIFNNIYKDRKDKPDYKKQFDINKKYDSSSDTDELLNETSDEDLEIKSDEINEIINSNEIIDNNKKENSKKKVKQDKRGKKKEEKKKEEKKKEEKKKEEKDNEGKDNEEKYEDTGDDTDNDMKLLDSEDDNKLLETESNKDDKLIDSKSDITDDTNIDNYSDN
jgi:hypothetical protein